MKEYFGNDEMFCRLAAVFIQNVIIADYLKFQICNLDNFQDL